MSQQRGAHRKQSQAPAPQEAVLMRMPIGPEGTPDLAAVGAPPIQQAVVPTAAADRAPESFEEQLAEAPSGQSLDSSARQYLEPRFGHSFGDIRVHADGHADQMARAVDANAFTHGQDIFFRSGAYDPTSPRGLQLIAHEAAHTLQQPAGTREAAGDSLRVSSPSDHSEQQASSAAAQVVSGGHVNAGMLGTVSDAGLIQRQPDAGSAAAAPAAAPGISTPDSYDYPPDAAAKGRLPMTGTVTDLDPGGLYDAVIGAPWARTTRGNDAWQGWTEIGALTRGGLLARNMADLTSPGGFSQTLTPDAGTFEVMNYRIQIKAKLSDFTFERADGVKVGQSVSGSVGVTSAGSVTGTSSATLTGGGSSGGGKDNGPSGSGSLALGGADSRTQGSGVTLQGGAQNVIDAQATALFSCKVTWEVKIFQVAHATTFAMITTLGGVGIGNELTGDRNFEAAPSEGTAHVRALASECVPHFEL